MPRHPSVDVIIPCYNYGAYLEGCVGSIFDNAGVEIRVLVIDDASTDDTPRVAARLAASDSRITYRRHQKNAGHIATYNEGLEWIAADYVLLISADDLLAPGALTHAVAAFDRHPEAVLVHGRQILFTDAPPLLRDPVCEPGEAALSGRMFIADLCAQAHNPVATPTVVVRTEAQKLVGGYDATLPHTADLELWLRLATVGSVVRLDCVQAFKRQHARNMQLAYVRPSEGDVVERQSAFERFFEGPGQRLVGWEAMSVQVRASLATELVWRAAAAFDAADSLTCDRLLALAFDTWPGVTRTRPWRRMQIKKRLGPGVWSRFRDLGAFRHRLTT